MIDPTVSEYFRELRKKVKNPYLPFKNKDYAREMSRKAVDARKRRSQTQEGS